MNLNHRLNGYNLKSPTAIDLVDAVDDTAERAEAIVLLLQSQFVTDECLTLSHGTIFNTLESIRMDLQDIRAISAHFHEAQRHGE